MTALLIEATKQQQNLIRQQQKQIAAQQAQIAHLATQVRTIMAAIKTRDRTGSEVRVVKAPVTTIHQ